MKQLVNKFSTQTIVIGLVAAFIWLQSRVQSILPAVMQDEYIYSMQARKVPLAELDYPNYLYSLVYSSTNACGVNYYSCAKNLNLFFFAGFVAIIFFLSLHFLDKWWAFGLSVAALLSPLGAYTSLFMPESMYFFFALASLVILWWASKAGLWWQYLIAGSLVGLTALIKPHALFLAAGAVLFLVVVHFKSWSKIAVAIGSYVGGTLVTKFALGFAIAGPSGLTLFGSSYTSSLNNFTEDLRGSGLPESFSASTVSMAVAAGGGSNVVADFLGQTIFQIGWQSAAVFLLSGGLIAILLGSLKSADSSPELGEKRFAQLILISLGAMVLVIAAFAAMVTVLGDDHSNRLLLRYYEFLLAPLAIAAIAVAKHSPKGNAISVIAGLGTAAIGALGFLVWFPNLRTLFADSPIMMGVTSSEFAGGLTVAIALGLGVASLLRDKTRLATVGTLVIASLVFFGFSSVNRLHGQASTISEVDSAGIFARDYLVSADPATIHFVGANRQLTLASIFWLDKPDVKHTLVNPFEMLPKEQISSGTEWIMTFGGVRVDVTPRFAINGQGWSLLNVSSSSKHYFSQAMQDSEIASVAGLGPITNWGQWLAAQNAQIRFKEPVGPGAQMQLEVLVTPAGAGQRIELKLGDGVTYLDLPQAGTIASVVLDFRNTVSSDTIEVLVPGGVLEPMAFVSLERLN